jgi:hypothetical protein
MSIVSVLARRIFTYTSEEIEGLDDYQNLLSNALSGIPGTG